MIDVISHILSTFRSCFARKAAFNWFVVVIFGFMVRLDHYGVSAFVRWLQLKPSFYTSILAFFRATSWKLTDILQKWWQLVFSHCPLIYIKDRMLLAGDGIKINKEAERMPGVKKLHQESDNSGKAPYIYGHHYGAIGLLAGWVKKNLLHPPLCRAA
ncbi:MAG: hypothetical protein KGY56_15055 [Desulfobacterales bacterium]|nr:hypothetical protein [Desulfobacterales bacterium]